MKKFITDRQTVEDLNLMGRFKKDSVINIFDRTKTRSGRQALEDMFRNPMTDAEQINARSKAFGYYKSLNLEFPFEEPQIELIEYYMNSAPSADALSSAVSMFMGKCKLVLANNKAYEKVLEGMGTLAAVILGSAELLKKFPLEGCPERAEIEDFLSYINPDVVSGLKVIAAKGVNLSLGKAINADKLVRITLGKAVHVLMPLLAKLDVNMSVGCAAAERNFGFGLFGLLQL